MNLYHNSFYPDSDTHNIPLTVLEFYSTNSVDEEPGTFDKDRKP